MTSLPSVGRKLPLKTLLSFLGPGFLVTVGFIDPGNWATNIEGGSYDLVAMATHGHTFLGDVLFGSVSRALKHKIRIPLLLLRAQPGG